MEASTARRTSTARFSVADLGDELVFQVVYDDTSVELAVVKEHTLTIHVVGQGTTDPAPGQHVYVEGTVNRAGSDPRQRLAVQPLGW